MEKGGFHACTLEDTLAIAKMHSEAYIKSHFAEIGSQRISYLLERNVQELEMVVTELWNELHISAFAPADFELYFGDDGKMPPIAISGSDMEARLRGFVDRVDVWNAAGQKYFRVVDYKTGKKDFDYCDIYNGIGLQMLLYLFALARGGEAVLGEGAYPAGVQYFPARAPVVASDGALSEEEAEALRIREWKRKGLLLQDEVVLQAMQPEGTPKRLDFTVKKDGSITGGVATSEEMDILEKYVMLLLSQIVDDITSGDITANPYTRGSSHNACAYCPYSQICHSEQVEGRRDYAAMKAEEFWDRIRKKVTANG
jgi:ATP-dependent helicase/nuclease subunit B